MGEFLSVPNKEKVSEDIENNFVINFFNISRLKSAPAECKVGESVWRIPTSRI